jgi:hypothetical protein
VVKPIRQGIVGASGMQTAASIFAACGTKVNSAFGRRGRPRVGVWITRMIGGARELVDRQLRDLLQGTNVFLARRGEIRSKSRSRNRPKVRAADLKGAGPRYLTLRSSGSGTATVVVGWAAVDYGASTSAKVNDTATWPCPGGGEFQYTGITAPSAADAGLSIGQSKKVYFFGGEVEGGGTLTDTPCNGSPSQSSQPVVAGPSGSAPFALPAAVGQLSETSVDVTAPNFLEVSTNWSLSFTATPNYNPDDDCKQDGGSGSPVSSSVGCQNQSLGEDAPIVGTGFNLH